MTPMDWADMPQRLETAEKKVRALMVEVEALRDLVVRQAVEIKGLKDEKEKALEAAA